MKKLIAITSMIFAVVILWHGCSKPEETGTIYGTVTDSATGVPLPYVQVALRPGGWTALTGVDGTYQFENLKPGQYSLSCTKTGYSYLEEDYLIELASGENVRHDVLMQKIQVLPRITDVEGNEIAVLDFGADQSLITKSFYIRNAGLCNISCSLFHNSNWIASVTPTSASIPPGQITPVIVTIDRSQLNSGINVSVLCVSSEDGVNELEIRAIGPDHAAVTTAEITNITANTATCGGNVVSDGGSPVTARGVCWSTSGTPTLNDAHTTNGSGVGSFTANMTGLTPETTYYVRAYATNGVGTSYGEQQSFTTSNGLPVVMMSGVSNITATTAMLNGNVTYDGGFAITERGFCWSTIQAPTVSDSHSSAGTGLGTFISSITNLMPNTTYYVRAYATNIFGTTYSNQYTFTTSQP